MVSGEGNMKELVRLKDALALYVEDIDKKYPYVISVGVSDLWLSEKQLRALGEAIMKEVGE